MTNGLNDKGATILTYLVYVLLTLLTLVSLYHFYMIANLPETYVRLERYRCDIEKLYKTVERVDENLDKLVDRQSKKDR